MSEFHKLRIKEIKSETDDAISILFNIPKNLVSEYRFIAGQYIVIKYQLKNEEVRRAYSICSSPNSQELKVAIKRVKDGHFSVFATTQLKEGIELEVSLPEGKFVLETNLKNTKNYLAFAAGSGITPIIAMIKAVLETEKQSKFVLVFGNKSRNKTLFFNELNQLQQDFSNRFFIQYVFSKEQPKDALFGRIDQSIVNYSLKKHINLEFDAAFLCGPEQMIETVKNTLIAKNFNTENIHFELFKPKKKMKENTKLDGNTKITILLEDETTRFNMKQNETILDAALNEDLDAPYSCQGGICSSCIAKVTEGKAMMVKNTVLSDDEVAEGLILTCQAHPTTEKITINFDDV